MQEILKNLNKKQKIIFVILVFIIMLIIFIWLYTRFYDDNGEIITSNNDSEENETEQIENSKLGLVSNAKSRIIIDVTGEVNNPGVVTLNEGARIIDAINAAGGKTEEADLSRINLAYILEDGVQLYVPKIGEDNNINKTSQIKENEQEATIQYIKTDAGEGIITTEFAKEEEQTVNTKININTANKIKLETLPGIGDSTAQKIIEYREKNGRFKTIEDIKNVSGIGDSKYNTLKDKITI